MIICKDSTKIDATCTKYSLNLPTLHNDLGWITFRAKDSTLVDSVYYNFSAWGVKGFSLERYDWSYPAVDERNWNLCVNPEGHSACQHNSKTIPQFGVAIEVKQIEKIIEYFVLNIGKNSLTNVEIVLSIVYSTNEFEQSREFFRKRIDTLSKFQSFGSFVNLDEIIGLLDSGFLKDLIVEVSYDSATGRGSSFKQFPLSLVKPYESILINEFLYNVEKGSGEFIELYNTTSNPVSLFKWRIYNRGSQSRNQFVEITDTNFVIQPKDFVAIIWDSAFFNFFDYLRWDTRIFCTKGSFSLRNNGDDIVVFDRFGYKQDSLSYNPLWHKGRFTDTKNKSLEKSDPLSQSWDEKNWFTSVSNRGSTPLEVNSVSLEQGEDVKIIIEPQTFSPNRLQGSFVKILFFLPFRQSRVTLDVYDLNGIKIANLMNNEVVPSVYEFQWDGRDSNGENLRSGGYVLLLEVVDIVSGQVAYGKELFGVGW